MKRAFGVDVCENCLPIVNNYKQKCITLSQYIEKLEAKNAALEDSSTEWKAKYEELASKNFR